MILIVDEFLQIEHDTVLELVSQQYAKPLEDVGQFVGPIFFFPSFPHKSSQLSFAIQGRHRVEFFRIHKRSCLCLEGMSKGLFCFF